MGWEWVPVVTIVALAALLLANAAPRLLYVAADLRHGERALRRAPNAASRPAAPVAPTAAHQQGNQHGNQHGPRSRGGCRWRRRPAPIAAGAKVFVNGRVGHA